MSFPAAAGEPPQQLKGFQKVSLAAGQSQQVTFTLTRRDLSFAVASPRPAGVTGDTLVVEPGAFDIWVTSSAAAGNASRFELLGPGCDAAP